MRKWIVLEKIEKEIEIEKLAPNEQLKLVEKHIHRIKKTEHAVRKEFDRDKLYGLGKGLWKGESA